MHDDDLRAYARRPWHVLAAFEQDHWASELASRGPLATLEASQTLWTYVRSIQPDWPTDAERREDFAHHVALKQAIDSAASAFAAARR